MLKRQGVIETLLREPNATISMEVQRAPLSHRPALDRVTFEWLRVSPSWTKTASCSTASSTSPAILRTLCWSRKRATQGMKGCSVGYMQIAFCEYLQGRPRRCKSGSVHRRPDGHRYLLQPWRLASRRLVQRGAHRKYGRPIHVHEDIRRGVPHSARPEAFPRRRCRDALGPSHRTATTQSVNHCWVRIEKTQGGTWP